MAGASTMKYGETEAAAAEMLRDIAVRAATGLDEIGAVCGDGRRLLELISTRKCWRADLNRVQAPVRGSPR